MNNKFAFVFPGQGSQSIGMLSSLAVIEPEVKHLFAQASDVLGYDLWEIVSNGPETQLNKTDITQPALLTAGVAVWNVWKKRHSVSPSYMAGHSLGEYSALVCAESLSFSDAVKLVATRGQLMQQAVAPGVGAMAAILGLEDQDVIELCTTLSNGELVSAVNFNSPGQIVVAGHKNAVEKVITAAKAKGAKRALILPVSVPSHCKLMQPAADELKHILQQTDFKSPTIPVIQNVSVESFQDPSAIKDALVSQLYSPVRWVETIQSIANLGVNTIVECGPGKVLTGLVKRIDKNIKGLAMFDGDTIDQVYAGLEE